jgi:hypothetical protein
MTEPILLTSAIRYDRLDGVSLDGNYTGSGIALRFDGDMLVDTAKVPGSSIAAIVPVDAFEGLVYQLLRFAIDQGIVAPHAFTPCSSTFIQRIRPVGIIDTRRPRWLTHHCSLPNMHACPHLAGNSSDYVWTSAQAREAMDQFIAHVPAPGNGERPEWA